MDGDPVHAEFSDLEGEDAFYELSVWDKGQFSYKVGDGSPKRTIQTNGQSLLMEATRRMDEWNLVSSKIPNLDVVPHKFASGAGEDYVVVMTEKDSTPLKVYQKYLRSADEWRQITEHNLLKEGVAVKVPADMLKAGMIPAKVTKFWARPDRSQHSSSRDWKWVKVVDDLLVQEGDWIRTRAKSSVEIKQDDGTVIILRPNTKILFESNGQAQTARGYALWPNSTSASINGAPSSLGYKSSRSAIRASRSPRPRPSSAVLSSA